jgi:nondiscriminating aspartyl-tRNA synthetase
MQRILSSELALHIGERVTLAGWVNRRRELKSVSFLILRDRAGLAQVVVPTGLEMPPEETVVQVTGIVAANEIAPGGVEVVEPEITLLSGVEHQTPFEIFRPTLSPALPVQLEHAPLSLRHPSRRDGLKIGAEVTKAFRETLDGLGFTEIFTPKIVGSATESGSSVFTLDYFGQPAYLAQSPQFYKQLMVGVFERVYEVGPVFRAEKHDTTRHLAQYTSMDAELGFIEDHHDVMRVLRDVMAGMFGRVSDIEVPEEVPAVHFTEALRITGADPSEPDLAPADERALCEWALREHGTDFLYVTGFPLESKPFYTHPDPLRPGYTNGFDLLYKGLELVTGGQRLHRYEDYVAELARRGEPIEPVRSYVESFKVGYPPHGGFAIGLERLVAKLTGAANVREITAFPRDLHRVSP